MPNSFSGPNLRERLRDRATMGGRLGQQFLFGPRGVGQLLLDQGKPVNDVRGQRGVGQFHRDGGDQSGSRSSFVAAVTGRVGLA